MCVRVYDFSIVPTDVILCLISLCFLKMSNESVTSLKKRVYIKIMIIKLKTRWEAFLICKNNQPKVSLFFSFFLHEHYGKTGGFNLVDEKTFVVITLRVKQNVSGSTVVLYNKCVCVCVHHIFFLFFFCSL